MQQSHVQRSPRNGERGMLLISSLLIVSLFLVYSSSLALRTSTQQRVADQLHDRLQAMDAAQGTTEQLREVLYAGIVTAGGGAGDAQAALQWLDRVGTNTEPSFTYTSRGQALQVPPPGEVSPMAQSLAWVTSVTQVPPPGLLAPRQVTIYAEATVGSTTKRIQATYQVDLGTSDVFRNAYFVNNYGWFTLANPTKRLLIDGDVRANGNLDFTGAMSRLYVNGDLYAAVNPEMGAAGTLTGNPSQFTDLPQYHQGKTDTFSTTTSTPPTRWNPWGRTRARPARQLTLPGQPVIGGGPPKVLPTGMGWDGNETDPNRKFPSQPIQPMPYMGQMTFYRNLATGHLRVPSSPFGAGTGSQLRYRVDTNGDGNYFNDGSSATKTLTAAYDPTKGPDQIANNADDGKPLVLWGNAARPIVIDGPVVIPGDVIIRGVVQGRGTIYAGRNVHIVGEVQYLDVSGNRTAPEWPAVQRNTSNGRLRRSDTGASLGRLCPPNDTFTTAPSCPP